MAPAYRLTERLGANARVVALRSVSIALGALLLVVVYAAGRTLTPQRPELAPLAAGIVAFIPMHTAMTATINNDTLAELLASATLLVVLRGLQRDFGPRGAVMVGALGGALLLTKTTVYVFAPLAFLALALRSAAPDGSGRPPRLGRAVRYLVLAAAVAGLLAGWWFLRNLAVYGWPDLFGLIRHDQVVVGQPRWPGLGDNLESVRFFGYSMFRSFWAQFGWMAVVLDPRFYWLFLLLSLLAMAGLRAFWQRELPDWPAAAGLGLRFLLAALGLVVLQVVAYNLAFIQAQGRYLYPAILPIALLLALGWTALAQVSPSASRWRWLGFGLGFYWLWAAAVEALAWLLTAAPAPLFLHLLTIAPTYLATRVDVRSPPSAQAATAAAALVFSLALVDLAALTRFVVPYFAGW